MFGKKMRVFLSLLLLLAVSCGPVLAAKPAPPPVDPLEQDANLANSIAKILGFSVDSAKVTELRQKKYGYGEIALVYSLSHVSRKPSWEIIAMRDRSLGWGEIAKQIGANMGKALNGVSQIMKDIKLESETEKLKEQIAKEPKQKGTK
ncbi:MAG: hypothetical protein N2491_13275 [Negativicutes bacterium]|nr:hypothetical protein [Negativicutes bacterium]